MCSTNNNNNKSQPISQRQSKISRQQQRDKMSVEKGKQASEAG